MIRKASIRTKGGTGRSGLDADGWRSILAPNSFGTSSSDLRKTFANVVQKLCTNLVETRLVSLDKCPGQTQWRFIA